jgi:hypothetical protein
MKEVWLKDRSDIATGRIPTDFNRRKISKIEKRKFIIRKVYDNFIGLSNMNIPDSFTEDRMLKIGQFNLKCEKSRFSISIRSKSYQKVMNFFYIDTKRYQGLSIKLLSESSEFEVISEDTLKADYQRIE